MCQIETCDINNRKNNKNRLEFTRVIYECVCEELACDNNTTTNTRVQSHICVVVNKRNSEHLITVLLSLCLFCHVIWHLRLKVGSTILQSSCRLIIGLLRSDPLASIGKSIQRVVVIAGQRCPRRVC